MNILLEIPVFTVEAALKAADYGANRLELCNSFYEGGETPGPGFLSYLKEKIDIPVFVMVRPRGGNFVYTGDEIEVMKNEIEQFSVLGADGFVFGILNPDGSVNIPACQKLIQTAGDKPCTFHRAFDVCRDQKTALQKIIDCGFRRILTSGGKNSVKDGLPQIICLLEMAEDRIIIMPGGGMKPEFVEPLRKTGYLKEVHASCKIFRPLESRFTNPDVRLIENDSVPEGVLTVDKSLVKEYQKLL